MPDLKRAIAQLREVLRTHATDLPFQIRVSCEEIEAIQRRLGTPDELPEDTQRVRTLVHEVSNYCTRLTLQQGWSSAVGRRS